MFFYRFKNYKRQTGFLLCVICVAACAVHKNSRRSSDESVVSRYHNAYDDSTLNNNNLPVLMPYNRIIDPAGTTITFGQPNAENHSLDIARIPGTQNFVVEDRFGIVIADASTNKIIKRWAYKDDGLTFTSTYSGLKAYKENNATEIYWSAVGKNGGSSVLYGVWDGKNVTVKSVADFKAVAPSPQALPNEVLVNKEADGKMLYVVLNGNNQLVKINLDTHTTIYSVNAGVAPYGLTMVNHKVFVTNWGGNIPADTTGDKTAGVPYGAMSVDPVTGAAAGGSVTVLNSDNGQLINQIGVGLHPNDIIHSPDEQYVYVANANSDNITVLNSETLAVTETISVRLHTAGDGDLGDSPNALTISADGSHLYVANGMDNAVAVIRMGAAAAKAGKGASQLEGFIPTEAYPGGLDIVGDKLVVANIEGIGSRVNSQEINDPAKDKAENEGGAYNSHKQKATVTIIPLPDNALLATYTQKVKALNLAYRTELSRLKPRKNIAPKPMPERIGEPSVFKHVLYIIKENRTYDQVLGDMKEGNGKASLCTFGAAITPNQHQLAKEFHLMDNYYASGKCSAEGHQWTDAGMVTDYIEKNVGVWYRSYPHVQYDAMVYDANGFIWNHALSYGKSVRIYGEACRVEYQKKDLTTQYQDEEQRKPFKFTNVSTIAGVRPILSPNYPAGEDFAISDQYRADGFIRELKEYENMPGDQLPQLMVMALSIDHTMGTRPGVPTPNAMVADNDLALGRIIEALSKSRFWKETVVFVTEDDSQAGWDHVSAYRTTGFVISPYSRLQKTIHTNYNQTCMLRSIEQILGIPPMNIIDATASPMFACFSDTAVNIPYVHQANQVPINEMNKALSALQGKDLYFATMSSKPEYDLPDRGDDDLMNRILWHYSKKKKSYPRRFAGKDED